MFGALMLDSDLDPSTAGKATENGAANGWKWQAMGT